MATIDHSLLMNFNSRCKIHMNFFPIVLTLLDRICAVNDNSLPSMYALFCVKTQKYCKNVAVFKNLYSLRKVALFSTSR